MTIERRSIHVPELRVPDDDSRSFEAVVLRYNVVDDYQTTFAPGAFTESLERRLPRIVWAHDWSEPLGRYVDYVDNDEELRLVGEFDDFDAVPRARQAHAQLRSRTIDQFSIGFLRKDDEPDPDHPGVTRITQGSLDEASLVLIGSVPGTQLLSVRSGAVVDKQQAASILTKLGAGDIDLAEALTELKTIEQVAGDDDVSDDGVPDGSDGGGGDTSEQTSDEQQAPDDEPPPPSSVDELDGLVDEALELVGDRVRR